MDCRRNCEDDLKGIWQSWDEAKKTRFRDKYCDVTQLLFVKLDDALLKAMVRFWDPTYNVLHSMKWIWYRLSRNILPFSTMTLEICSRYIRCRTFSGTLSQFVRITCRYTEGKIKG
ncbi:hypothetical protein Goarm_011222 [Gossypium armourianum]|uniref:Uncharacterized protein n=2 Tax=Gossypium armourianum TaxID=34283 RepID=A0A7J9IWW9_9ROSI|nr:hypothetical protein [Gossypium armourianum]